jgi:D,D-heptose 1,7-bisphosphate phosphatase
MRQALILVGGRGTRLGALAADTPKPLLPIAGDVRFLDYLIANLSRHGVSDVILLAGHLAETVERRYRDAEIGGARVRVVVEPEPAGTAGALTYARDLLDDDFLMMNGDSILDFNYLALTTALTPDDLGVLALRRIEEPGRYGRVETRDGRVLAFREKDPDYAGEALISGGVYLLRRAVLDLVTQTPCSIETDVFPVLAARGALGAVEASGYFIDIGLPETLSEARDAVPDELRRGAVFFDRDGTLSVDHGYTFKPEDLVWQPGAIEAVRACNDAGRLVFVITNQSGLARGLYTEADMRRFHEAMQAALTAHGAHVDAFYHCPFHREGSVARFCVDNHPDRKPNAGMLRRAMLEWPIDAARSFVIGDTDLDTGAAEAVGLPSRKVAPGEILSATQALLAATSKKSPPMDHAAALKDRAAQARAWLFDHALPLWWEKGFDRATGAYFERLNLDGTPASLPRRIRVQARQTVVYARAGRLGWPGPWRAAVEAGVKVLLEKGLRPDGGTRHMLDENANLKDERRDLYDLAFVLFALAEAAQVLDGRADLIATAEELLTWLEANWSHPAGGFLEGDITPVPPRRQNPHMHMFEACLALFEATKKPERLARASRIAALFRDRFFDRAHAALPEYFDDGWTPIAGEEGRIAEPGHQFEWSWLLHRWQDFGGEGLGDIPEKLRVHGEVYGVDPATGVTIDEVYVEGMVRTRTSRFWPHTERIKASVARYRRTKDPMAAAAAVQAFDVLMTYCDVPTKGLWRDRRLAEGGFVEEPAPASSFYHAMFAMYELIEVAG